MRRFPFADRLLLVPAVVFVLARDAAAAAWRRLAVLTSWLGQRGRLPLLRAWVGRLPPALALPLFLVPEICSRCGWLASGWLLLQGRTQAALLVYLASKLIAGLAALWVFHACKPALMRIGWFARLYCTGIRALATLRAPLRESCPGIIRPDPGPGQRAVILAREWLRSRKKHMTAPSKHDN